MKNSILQYASVDIALVLCTDKEDGGSSATDTSRWSTAHVASVARQIAERVRAQALHSPVKVGASQASLSKKMSQLRSCPFSLPEELQQLSQHREGLPLVVIGLHPQQKPLVGHPHLIYFKHQCLFLKNKTVSNISVSF